MGFWGFKPFQNDYALDDYGGYSAPEHLKGLIWQGIRRGEGDYVDVHEIMGMILRTFKVYDGICNVEDEQEMARAISTETFTEKTAQAMAGESPMMIMSCATIDLKERKKMLEYAANKMMGIIERNNSTQIEYKKEPKTFNDFFDAENRTNPIFDNDKMWVQDVSDDEENSAYQEIYNLSRKVINNEFKDITNPMVLTPESVAWLVKMEKVADKTRYIKRIRDTYKEGLTVVKLSKDKVLTFDNVTLKIAAIDGVDKYGAYVMPIGNGKNYYDTTNEDIGAVEVNARDWFIAQYPNGFYWGKARLFSIDTKNPLKYMDDTDIQFDAKTVELISKYIQVYRTKVQYETAMAEKKRATEQKAEQKTEQKATQTVKGIQVKCVNKSYKGNRIYAYELMDVNGKTMWVHPDQLKQAIKTGQVTCINMTLTSDNRLIIKKN